MKKALRMTRLMIAAFITAAILMPVSLTPATSLAQDSSPAKDNTTKKFSDDVVAKAEKILQASGLRRSGKSIQSSETSDLSRAIAGLAREKRELRLLQGAWKEIADQIAMIKQELRRLNAQDVDLNMQLVRVAAGDVTSNNRIIALLNASRARTSELIDQREELKKKLVQARADLNSAETKYADTVIAIRKDYTTTLERVNESLADDQVQIALRVMEANFETPKKLSAEQILNSLDKRIAKIEQEVFNETIALEVERGALYVEVVVGKKTARMVVDSGAAIVTLPAKTAVDLGIEVPLDAKEIKLVLADGRSIPARGVTLPRVRIGEFVAENVEAAVMDAVAIQAEPLLGMSFLGNFKFEINTQEKSLKLLRVAAE